MKRLILTLSIMSITCQAQATSAAAIAGGVFGGLLLADVISTKMANNDVGDNYLQGYSCQNCDRFCSLPHCGVYPAQAYYPYYYY